MDRYPDSPCAICNCPRYGLPDPPCWVCGELVTFLIIIFFSSLHESHVAFLDKVKEWQPPVEVFLGNINHESQVCLNEPVPDNLQSIFNFAEIHQLPSYDTCLAIIHELHLLRDLPDNFYENLLVEFEIKQDFFCLVLDPLQIIGKLLPAWFVGSRQYFLYSFLFLVKPFYSFDGGYGFLLIFLLIFLHIVHFVDTVDHIYYVYGLFLQLLTYFQEFIHRLGQLKQDVLGLFFSFFNLFRYLVFFIRCEEWYMSHIL